MVEHARIGGSVGAGCPSNGRLIDIDDLVNPVHALHGRVETWWHLGPVHLLHEGFVEDLIHQSGFPGSRHSGNGHKASQGELHV